MGNVNMEASQINYRGGEKKMSVEEALKNTSGEAAAIAQLQTDVLNLNSNKANQITIAPFFSAEASYDPGDLVYYNGLSYRCVNAHEGEWDADDFAATTIAGELDALKSGLIGVKNPIVVTKNVNITPTETGAINYGTVNIVNAGLYLALIYLSIGATDKTILYITTSASVGITTYGGNAIKLDGSYGPNAELAVLFLAEANTSFDINGYAYDANVPYVVKCSVVRIGDGVNS